LAFVTDCLVRAVATNHLDIARLGVARGVSLLRTTSRQPSDGDKCLALAENRCGPVPSRLAGERGRGAVPNESAASRCDPDVGAAKAEKGDGGGGSAFGAIRRH